VLEVYLNGTVPFIPHVPVHRRLYFFRHWLLFMFHTSSPKRHITHCWPPQHCKIVSFHMWEGGEKTSSQGLRLVYQVNSVVVHVM
jgi:hypothetical protein